MVEEHDPDFDVDEPGSSKMQQPEQENQSEQQEPASEAVEAEASSMPKAKKKRKRRAKQADDAATDGTEGNQPAQAEGAPQVEEGESSSLPPVEAKQPEQPALPNIFGNSMNANAAQFQDVIIDGQDEPEKQEDLEISDGEAPDVEDAKRNLRSQAEKKRKQKKTVVGGVTGTVEIEGQEQEQQAEESAFEQQVPQEQADQEDGVPKLDTMTNPGLGGDQQAPVSEMDDSQMHQQPQQEDERREAQTPQQEEEEKVAAPKQQEELKLPPIGGASAAAEPVDSEAYALQLQAQYDAENAAEESEEEAEGRNRRRNRGKKGRRRQSRQHDQVAGMDMNFRDNDDIELQPDQFSREHFRKLIKKTFDDYYPLEYNKSSFNMDQYLQVVQQEQLEAKFSTYLEVNDDNVLTLRNMPWLDLGELPVSYNTHKSEAFQVYMVPRDEIPYNMVVMYDNWHARFDYEKAKVQYNKTQLSQRNIQQSDVIDTLQRATDLVVNYRGQLARRNRIVKLSLAGIGLIFLFFAILVGMMNHGNYWGPMLLAVGYILIFLITTTVFKYRSSYQMRMSQFLLSVFCRAENNRLYLKNGVELRPGFLGKWIELTCVESPTTEVIIQNMRQRFLKPCLEQKAAAFDKNIMSQDALIKEQKDIENQIRHQRNSALDERDQREHNEVAAARLESNPNDFSQEHELSMQALGINTNSQAALGVYDGQPDGLPPSTVGQMGMENGKKPKKGKKKRKKAGETPNADQPKEEALAQLDNTGN